MKITVEKDGKTIVYEDVIDYGIIDRDEVEATCEANGVELTDEVIKEVERECGRADHLLSYEELAEVVLQYRFDNDDVVQKS